MPDRGSLVTTAIAAQAATVEPDTIHKWHERGFLTRYGTRRGALWDLDELARVVFAQRGQRKQAREAS